MKTKIAACALSLLLLSSCGGDQIEVASNGELIAGSDAKKLLASNKEKWSLRNIKSYQYKYKISCFCMDNATSNKQVTVSNGAITEAFYLQTSEYLTPEELKDIETIDGLFNIIEDAIKLKAHQLNVSYNKEYGYPETISIDFQKDVMDDEITYYATDLM